MELGKERWSENLKKIKPEVERILYKGNIDLLVNDAPKLAIVGSRRITDYGAKVIEKWMPALVQKGVTVVSGFMYGVDQAAHRACIENGGKTIAVLGWGIGWQVAQQDEELYQKILEGDSSPAGRAGLIVSEYEGKMEPLLWMFPARNRIVAGISDAVLVVEGAEKSGSLITARLALQFGKPLLAVPGPVFSRVSAGTNNLIKDGKAIPVCSAEDVLKVLGLTTGQLGMGFKEKAPTSPILSALEAGERGADELSRGLKMPVSRVMVEVFRLQLEGLVEEKAGKYRRVV